MSTAGLINRYVWFVTTIYNRGPISLEEIQHRYESQFGRGEELSERQFHRYTDAVEELFDIEIKYSRTRRGYVVSDREGIYNMGMTVAEARHDISSLCIDIFRIGFIFRNNSSEFLDNAVFNNETGIIDAFDMPHILAFQLSDLRRQDNCQLSDIIYDFPAHLIL